MRTVVIIVIVSALVSILSIPMWFDTATSVVPGWHTAILPPAFIAAVIVYLFILIVTVAYLLLYLKAGTINRKVFISHILLTLPSILLTIFPELTFYPHTNDVDVLQRQITLAIRIVSGAYLLFIAGQVLFTVYFIQVIIPKRKREISILQ